MNIQENIKNIINKIGPTVKLVAVSKTRSIQDIKKAYNSGQKIFGENRVQELVGKFNRLPRDIEWHMIGHLQKNKVKYISSFIDLIHSLDRISLAKEINNCAKKENRKIDCLIQLKISKEDSKFGLEPSEIYNFYSELINLNHINVVGLMGMASFTSNESIIKDEFKSIHKIYNKLKDINPNINILSIGMSDDYEIAIRNGSNMIRVGSKIFGNRNQ